jgi:Putative adhesin
MRDSVQKRSGLILAAAAIAALAPAVAAAQPPRAALETRLPVLVQERGEGRREQRGRNNERESQTEKTSRTLNIGADGELDVSNISGDIVVTRGGGNAATIEIVKTARGATVEDARALLAMVTVDVVERGNRAEVRARYPRQDEMRRAGRRNFNIDINYTISAPANTRLVAKSISGNVSVSDITGAVTAESISGTVKLANAGRATTAKTISGNVEMADSKVDGALSAGTISGQVRLVRVSARSLSLSSVSGEVILEDVSSERIEAQAISGSVRFSGELEANGRYELTSHSGDVRLALGSRTGFQLEASSFSGGISSDLPITLEGTQAPGRRARSMRGKYGNGSAIVDLTSFSGSITITKR